MGNPKSVARPVTIKPLIIGMMMPKASIRPPTLANSFRWRLFSKVVKF
jgi:hypothetical protein